MAEQRKAASAGDQNAVTHEPADPTTGPEVSDAAKRAAKDKRVTLRVTYPHVLFDLTAQDLPSVTQEGTTYTSAQADTVKTLAMKCGVPVTEVPSDEEEN